MAISFYYDPYQRLVSRHWPAPRGDDALYYDGPDVVLELRYPSAGGSQWVRYVHGPGADQPLATEVYPLNAAPAPGAGSQYYYHADGEGSIRLLTDVNGQIANRYDYDSYGQRLSVIESLPLQPYGWKGREWIPGPNIYYNRARFYDPVLGRFMSQDPLGYGGGDWNQYSFGWNNPRNWNDPSGMSVAIEYGGELAVADTALLNGVSITTGIATGAEAAELLTEGHLSSPSTIAAELACNLFIIADAFAATASGNTVINKAGCTVANTPSQSRSIPTPPPPKKGCTAICRADANDNIPGNIKDGDITFAFGEATAPSCVQAIKEAKRIATHSLGKQPKHIGCRTNEG